VHKADLDDRSRGRPGTLAEGMVLRRVRGDRGKMRASRVSASYRVQKHWVSCFDASLPFSALATLKPVMSTEQESAWMETKAFA